MSGQNDPSSHGQRLRRRVGSDQVLKVLDFFSGQFNGISRFGTSHELHHPDPVYPVGLALSNSESS